MLLVLVVVSLHAGVYRLSSSSVLGLLWGMLTGDTSVNLTDAYVIGQIRLPRIVMGVFVGSVLAVSGTCLQGLFKNPLAMPDVMGITAGATLMAAISIVLGAFFRVFIPEYLHFSLISIGAFLGALAATSLVYKISTSNGKTNVALMLLSGVAITALCFAITGFMIYLAKDDQLRDLTFWNLGSLGAATWSKNLILGTVMLASYSVLISKGKALNAMMLGEKDAEHLGVNVERIKKQIVVLVALMVGTSVAFSGGIGFVGLIVPYILRLLFKSNYAVILPLSAILGSVLLLGADTISRTIVAPTELPIGIITAFLGAPIFIAILIRYKNTL